MLDSRSFSRHPGGPDLERFVFWRGQHLASRDLNDLGTGEEERLFWHNRAVHDAYGIVVGLTVDASTPPEVTVQAGLAYDAYGRELALYAPVTLARPAEADSVPDPAREVWSLLLRRRDASAHGGCGCGNGEGGAPGSELVWRRARQVGLKDGVVLARGWWIPGTPDWTFVPDPDFHPLRARPITRPRIGTGATPRGGTAWQLWSLPPDPRTVDPAGAVLPGIPIPAAARGIEVTVDTSAAGFTRVPCYFAWLQGGIWPVPWRLVRTLPLERITFTARDRFTFSLWDTAASTNGPTLTDAEGRAAPLVAQATFLNFARGQLYVCWLGIQTSSASFVGQQLLDWQTLDKGPR